MIKKILEHRIAQIPDPGIWVGEASNLQLFELKVLTAIYLAVFCREEA